MKRLVFALLLLAASCGGSSEVAVSAAWARPTPPGAATSAFFMTINIGHDADRLTAVSSDACDAMEIHGTTMTDGVMRMRPIEALVLEAGTQAVLESGGRHVMCLGSDPLGVGDEVELVLEFEGHPSIVVTAVVEDR